MPTASATMAPTLPSRMPQPAVRHINRRVVVVGAVVGLHVAALWALQSGLLRRAVELVVPVQVLAEVIELPQPQVVPEPPPPAPAVQAPPPKPRPQPVRRPEPEPVPVVQAEPSPVAPVVAPAPPAPPAPPEPVAAPPAPPAPPSPAPPAVTLPTTTAEYAHRPTPPYPSLSRRLGEQGQVLLRVFVEVNGLPSRVEVVKSSGYERLDNASRDAVMRWRYVPGKRGGTPEAMWVNVPLRWVLE